MTMDRSRKKLVGCVLGLLLAGWAVVSPRAATQNVYTWDGSAADGDWFNSANWTGPSGDGIPGDTHDPSGTVTLDQAAIGDVSGTIDYTPGTPTVFDYLNISKSDAALLTFNVNGDMTVEHNNVADPDWWGASSKIGAWGCNMVFNLNSGTLAIKQANVSIFATSFNIAAGATFMGFADAASANRRVTISSTLTTVEGWLGTIDKTSEESHRNNSIQIAGGEIFVAAGGTFFPDAIDFTSRYGTLTITNGATVLTRYGGSGFTHEGNYGLGYNHTIRMYGGVVTNRSLLKLAGRNPWGATGPGTVTLSLDGGNWYQGGAAYVADGRKADVVVAGGTLQTPADFYIGSARPCTDPAPDSVDYSGSLTITGGTVIVSNPDAGTVHTASGAGRQNPGGITHYFSTGSAWDHTYRGQRVVIDSLAGSGDGLATSTIYYVVDVNPIGLDAKSTFGFALTNDGDGLTGTASYSGGTYHTLPARLMVGNVKTFSGPTYVTMTGTLNLVSGSLTVDELVATNGTASILNISGGTLTTAATRIDTGSALAIGDGTGAPVLALGTGTHTFADGLTIAANATLAAGGIGSQASPSVSGNVSLNAGAVIHCDVVGGAGETIAVTGTVNLPATATVTLASDGSTPDSITLLTATTMPVVDVSGWTVSSIGVEAYDPAISGNALVLNKRPRGSMFMIR